MRDKNLLIWREKFIESFPPIAHDRHAASRGFEQAPRGAIAHFGHRAPRDVERETGRAVESCMHRWRDVPDEMDVARPREILRVLRAADEEAELREATCGF